MSQDLSLYLLALVGVASLAAEVDGELPELVSSEPTGASGWQCQRPGRFVNPDDPSCRTYVTCVPEQDPDRSRDAPFTQRLDECGPSALFSGRYQRCIAGSDCETLEDFYAIEYECGECGKFVLAASTDCRQFVNCLKTKDPGVFIPIRQSCPIGKLFSATAHGCVGEGVVECSPPKTTTTTVAPLTTQPQSGHLSDFVCLGPGRFPDESVPHCRGYRWCTAASGDWESTGRALGNRRQGQLVSRNFLCEWGHVFSEVEARCVPTGDYHCPDDGAGGTDRFRCAAVGRFPDRGARGCERYYRCQETAGGTLKALLEQCPAGTIFSWLTTRCVPSAEYVCPVAAIGATVEQPDELAEAAEVGPKAEERRQLEDRGEPNGQSDEADGGGRRHRIRCTRSGRFANDGDPLCRTYFICTRDSRGSWAKVLVRCPAGTVFSRAASRCVGAEVEPREPCPAQQRPVVAVASSSTPLPARDVSGDDVVANGSAEDLECTESDLLLPNPSDRTCRTYFSCREDTDDERVGPRPLRLHVLTCPAGTWFSAGAARCLSRTPADDMLDDGSGEFHYHPGIDDEPLRPDYCADDDPGSGDPPVALEPNHASWLPSTSFPPTVDIEPTTLVPGSTHQPTAAVFHARSTTPDAKGTVTQPAPESGDAGGLGSFSRSAPEYPCTATGRFADINSVDCRSYFLCKQQQASGSLVSVHLTCPDGTVFSRNVNKCTVSSRHVC